MYLSMPDCGHVVSRRSRKNPLFWYQDHLKLLSYHKCSPLGKNIFSSCAKRTCISIDPILHIPDYSFHQLIDTKFCSHNIQSACHCSKFNNFSCIFPQKFASVCVNAKWKLYVFLLVTGVSRLGDHVNMP